MLGPTRAVEQAIQALVMICYCSDVPPSVRLSVRPPVRHMVLYQSESRHDFFTAGEPEV